MVRDRPPDRADRRRSVVAADAPRHRGRAGEGGPRLRGAPIAAAGREDHPARSDAARELLTRITRAGTTDRPGPDLPRAKTHRDAPLLRASQAGTLPAS